LQLCGGGRKKEREKMPHVLLIINFERFSCSPDDEDKFAEFFAIALFLPLSNLLRNQRPIYKTFTAVKICTFVI
jgi:hypothetical protein